VPINEKENFLESINNVNCNTKEVGKEWKWKTFCATQPEMQEVKEKIISAKKRVLTASDQVVEAKKELLAAREDLIATKKKFSVQFRDKHDKKTENYSSSETDIKHPTKVFARFVKHVTIPENSELPANHEFIKTWRFRNEGNNPWPVNTKLQFVGKNEDDCLAEQHSYDIGTLAPGEEKDISIKMKSPAKSGSYMSYWRLFDSETKIKFGQRVCAQINVVGTSSSSDEDLTDKTFADSHKHGNKKNFKKFKGDLPHTTQVQMVKQLKKPKVTKH